MKCVLHIGTEKTGTTLLQHWLYENVFNLSEHGVALTFLSGAPNNRKLVAFIQSRIDDYFQAHGIRTEDERDFFFRRFREEFIADIKEMEEEHHTVIFTSEHFHSRLTEVEEIEKLRDLLATVFSEVKIVCYFREQSRVRTSLYSTALKGKSTKDINDFLPDIDEDRHYYNYFSFFGKWEQVFGIDALRPRLFERQHLIEEDIRIDFIKTALEDFPIETLTFETNSANKSLTSLQALLFREINKFRANDTGRFLDPTPVRVKELMLDFDFLKGGQRIYDPLQEQIYEKFNNSNVQFFSRYFGEERNLFDRPKPGGEPMTEVPAALKPVETTLAGIVGEPGMMYVKPEESEKLSEIAVAGFDSKSISADDALFLLKIANRAQPDDKQILSMIERVIEARMKG